jgi:hypothetical protein
MTNACLVVVLDYGAQPESIESFIEDQAFLRLYDLAHPSPPHPPLLPRHKLTANCLAFLDFLCVASREGGWGGAKSYDRENVQYSKNHSILSLLNIL